MKKKLLLASILTAFTVLSTMAQAPTYNLFIDSSGIALNRLMSGWAEGQNGDGIYSGDGWTWDGPNGPEDSVGAIGALGKTKPYEGSEQYEFKYNRAGWWTGGQLRVDKNWAFSNIGQDYSAYSHMKLYWLGYSELTPQNQLEFKLSSPSNTGSSVVVADSANQLTYVEKIIPLTSFLSGTLVDLTNIVGVDFQIINGGDGDLGLFLIDAIQFVDIASDSVLVEGNGFAAVPGETYKFDTTDIGNSKNIDVFRISNVKNSATLTLAGNPVISGTDAADFTIVKNPKSSTIGGGGKYTTFSIKFDPSTVGDKNAVLTISNDISTGGAYVINLYGYAADFPTGVTDAIGTDTYAAYPTPFTEETVIKINSTVSSPMSIKVMDTKGTVVSASEGHYTNEDITLGKGLEKGIFYVQVSYQDRVQVIKIVKM
jgi:hypothetical protein